MVQIWFIRGRAWISWPPILITEATWWLLNVGNRPRAPGAVGPGSRRCRHYADPPAATLLTGLAGGERLSQFLLQLVCPFLF